MQEWEPVDCTVRQMKNGIGLLVQPVSVCSPSDATQQDERNLTKKIQSPPQKLFNVIKLFQHRQQITHEFVTSL